MQQQLQQYFVLHTYFQAYGEKIPISEITLLLKNHQIWQYFKKGCQIGRQVVVENEAEVNRRKQTTTTSILDCSTYLETLIIHFSLDFLWQEGLSAQWAHFAPIQNTYYYNAVHSSYCTIYLIQRCSILHFFGRRDLKITCKCLPGWWGGVSKYLVCML